jgi:hypothetical protein
MQISGIAYGQFLLPSRHMHRDMTSFCTDDRIEGMSMARNKIIYETDTQEYVWIPSEFPLVES